MPDIKYEMELWVVNYAKRPELVKTIKMEVGIEECLHIEFEFNKSKYVRLWRCNSADRMVRYHLRDVVIGKVYFCMVRIRVMHMEVALVRKETAGTGTHIPNTIHIDPTTSRPKSIQRTRNHHQIRTHGRRSSQRRIGTHPLLPGRVRPHANVYQSPQPILGAVLPQSGLGGCG